MGKQTGQSGRREGDGCALLLNTEQRIRKQHSPAVRDHVYHSIFHTASRCKMGVRKCFRPGRLDVTQCCYIDPWMVELAFTSFQHWRCKNLTAHKHHTRWGGTCLWYGEWDLQSSSEGAYLQTDMQRAPQAADPSRLLIRLALWAGESQGRRRITRWASKVKRGYPGGWATWRGDDRWWEFRAWGAWMTVSWLVYNRYFLVCLSRWVCSSCCTNVGEANPGCHDCKVTLTPEPPLPLSLPLLSTFPLASSQGQPVSLEAEAEHVVLRQPQTPKPPPSCSHPRLGDLGNHSN